MMGHWNSVITEKRDGEVGSYMDWDAEMRNETIAGVSQETETFGK